MISLGRIKNIIGAIIALGAILVVLLSLSQAGAREGGDSIHISRDDIRDMQALKISDVLNNIPGVKVGDSSVSIHGSYKVRVMLDGRPINDPTSSHGGINWDLVSLDDVESIEILRGKGGLTYGQDASGGVILITTKKETSLTGSIKSYAGSNSMENVRASGSARAGKAGINVSGGYEATDGYQINDDKEKYQAGVKFNYSLDDSKTMDFSADYKKDERGLSGLPEYPTPHSRKESKNASYALQADLNGIKSRTWYNQGTNHNWDQSKGLDKLLDVTKFGQDLTSTLDIRALGNLAWGAGLTWDSAHGSSFEKQEENSLFVFGAKSLDWPGIRTTLTLGIRGNYNSEFKDTINPEIKLAYKQTAWTMTASYNRANNVPSLYQRYNETSSTMPNPDLDMESADNFSISLSTSVLNVLSLTVTGFYNMLEDRITYVTGDNGIGQYQNFGEVVYKGGDVATGWKIHPSLNAMASYAYIEAKDTNTGLWLPCKPRHTVNLSLYWRPVPRLSLKATGDYSSAVYKDQNNTKKVPKYTIAGIRSEYEFRQFSVFGEIKNLFDKTYYYADGYLAPPRTWLIGLTWKI